MTIRAIGEWKNNAEIMVACRDLGYLPSDDSPVLDPTYGLGRFWNLWRPANLTASDLDPAKSPARKSVDFTNLPWGPREFQAVVLDGPYKLNGTSHVESDEGYGVHEPATKEERHDLIKAGISEAIRVTKVEGFVLVKCQDQVCSQKMQWQTRIFADHAEKHPGVRLVDSFILRSYRVQPIRGRCATCGKPIMRRAGAVGWTTYYSPTDPDKNRSLCHRYGDHYPEPDAPVAQDHAHRDYSTLLVFKKELRRKT